MDELFANIHPSLRERLEPWWERLATSTGYELARAASQVLAWTVFGSDPDTQSILIIVQWKKDFCTAYQFFAPHGHPAGTFVHVRIFKQGFANPIETWRHWSDAFDPLHGSGDCLLQYITRASEHTFTNAEYESRYDVQLHDPGPARLGRPITDQSISIGYLHFLRDGTHHRTLAPLHEVATFIDKRVRVHGPTYPTQEVVDCLRTALLQVAPLKGVRFFIQDYPFEVQCFLIPPGPNEKLPWTIEICNRLTGNIFSRLLQAQKSQVFSERLQKASWSSRTTVPG